MSKNSHMNSARKTKNNEFYTQLKDIDSEIRNYSSHILGKKVYLNCDDPSFSKFWEYFYNHFDNLKLKSVMCTYYSTDEKSYLTKYDGSSLISNPLKGNGDFRSSELVEILEESDIVITNPPFSLHKEFLSLLLEHDKKFLFIGNLNQISNKSTAPHILDKKVWLGTQRVNDFVLPNGDIKSVSAVWYTNMAHNGQNIIHSSKFNIDNFEYFKFEGSDIINVDRATQIPMNYRGLMAVPISFLLKLNPTQFNIKGFAGVRVDGETYICGLKLQGSDRTTYDRIVIQAI